MAEQLSHMTSSVSEINEVGSHLTRFRRHLDEKTGYYVLSIDGSPDSVPLIPLSTPHPSISTGVGVHQNHPYTALLIPDLPSGVQNRMGTEDAKETYQFLEFVPTWATTQLSQTQVTTIGREPSADLCINDPTVSRRHAQIACIQQRYVLHDLSSKNGTFVNDTRLEPGKVWVLNPNDRIRFGKGLTYIFQLHPSRM